MATFIENYSKGVKSAGFWRVASWLSRLPLAAVTIIFALIGFRYLFDPVHSAAAAGIAFNSSGGITVARVGFGAFPLAFALITASCLASTRRLLAGLYIVLALISVVTGVRILGIFLDHSASQTGYLLIPEVVLLVLSLIAISIELRRRRRLQESS